MSKGTFDYDLRVLLCSSCASPMEMPVGGGEVTCKQCGARQAVAGRPSLRTAPRAAPAGAGDLAAQLASYDPDTDPYGYGAAPPGLEGVDTRDPFDAEKLKLARQAYPGELQRLTSSSRSFDDERRVYWLTTHMANMFIAQDQRLAARAARETALEALTDPGFRTMLLYAMTRNAAAEGNGGAAEQWLAQCDADPDTIAHFSSYRVARAAVALANGRAEVALDAVGPDANAVPMVGTLRPLAAFARVAALELMGSDEAATVWAPLVRSLPDHYVEAILKQNQYLEPCRRVQARAAGKPVPAAPPRAPSAAPAASTGALELVGESGDVLRCSIRTTVGRHLCAALGPDSQYCDELQFTVIPSPSGWQVSPNPGARNETLLNGKAIDGITPLRDGDVLAVGREARGVVKLPMRVKLT